MTFGVPAFTIGPRAYLRIIPGEARGFAVTKVLSGFREIVPQTATLAA
jgi:hypothetical protein